jgi:phage FluMu protein Com
MSSKTDTVSMAEHAEARCECGQLMAKVREDGLELKCKRCKRIVLIPFAMIEDWASLTTSTP